MIKFWKIVSKQINLLAETQETLIKMGQKLELQ